MLVTENCVIGGGICGLVVAQSLFKNQRDFILLEKESRVGGCIRTRREAREGRIAIIEEGPNTLLLRDQRLHDLFCELEVEEDRLAASPASKYRYILKDHVLCKLPMDPISLLFSPLFSARAKLNIPLGLVRKMRLNEDETVASFFGRLFHPDVVANVIGPFVSGVWAGDPEKLRFRYAFPKIYELFSRHGSLFGALFSRRAPAIRAQLSSFMGGMEQIVDVLSAVVSSNTKLNSRVQEIRKSTGGFELLVQGRSQSFLIETKQLFLCTPAYVTAELLKTSGFQLSSDLGRIPYVPLLTVGVVFKRVDVPEEAQEGFGFLIPRSEDRSILGAIFSSSLFPNRCADDEVLFTVYAGGRMREEIRESSKEELERKSVSELRAILGIKGEPVFVSSYFWDKAIPQFEKEYPQARRELQDISEKEGNIHFLSNYMCGISVADCMLESASYMSKLLAK